MSNETLVRNQSNVENQLLDYEIYDEFWKLQMTKLEYNEMEKWIVIFSRLYAYIFIMYIMSETRYPSCVSEN